MYVYILQWFGTRCVGIYVYIAVVWTRCVCVYIAVVSD